MNERSVFVGTAAILIAAACGASAAAFDDASWARSVPGFDALRQAAVAVPAPAASPAPRSGSGPGADELNARINVDFLDGHFWEVRRLSFKLAELDPRNVVSVEDLAYALAMMTRSDVDRRDGKDNVLFRESDFRDLGGLRDASLLAIATDDSLDGFAKGRAVYRWDEPKQSGNWEFYYEYGLHLAFEQGWYLIGDKKLAEGLALCRDGDAEFDASATLLRARPDAGSKALLSRVLLGRANFVVRLAGLDPADAAADKARAARDYREILSLPDVPAGVFVAIEGYRTEAAPIMAHGKSSALRHLKELGLSTAK